MKKNSKRVWTIKERVMDVLSENDYTARQIMDCLAEEFRTPTMREFAHILTGMVVEGEIECDMDGKVMRYSLKIDKAEEECE